MFAEKSPAIGQDVQTSCKGVRVGDPLTIRPAFGRKKTISLNRTLFHLRSTTKEGVEIRGTNILLPGPFKEKFHCELSLVEKRTQKTSDDRVGRYLLKSLTSMPFKINGTETFEAFVERGDRVLFGYNLFEFDSLTGVKREKSTLLNLSEELIRSQLNIVLTGETGVGKTRWAREIHNRSCRVGKFVHLNLSSFSPQLIESELFGHVKGAFTGAISEKMGAIHEANHGTLFLDEIDSLPMDLQTKLLLFLDSHEFRRVGGTGFQKANVRMIFASCSNLEKMVREGTLRKDLYFRFKSGGSQEIAPLRLNPSRIHEILDEYCLNYHLSYSREVLNFYQRQMWPGNVRQLIAHLERKRLVNKGRKLILDKTDWELELGEEELGLEKEEVLKEVLPLEEMRNRYVQKVYRQYEQKTEVASRALKISPTTLRRILRKNQQQESA